MTSSVPDRPTRQEIEQILEKLGPRIEDLLRRHPCAPEAAKGLIQEAVLALAHRWSRIRNHEWWLLDRLEKAVRRIEKPTPKEPRP